MIQVERIKVETPREIAVRWKAEGRSYRSADLAEEFKRQGREAARERESWLLAEAARLDPADQSFHADWLRQVAGQIADHRAAGRYTTQG